MKNLKKPKPLPGQKNNEKPELAYSIQINVFKNGSSNIAFDRDGVIVESVREILLRHTTMCSDQIILHKINEAQKKVQLIRPEQMNVPMKMRQ